jgi:hypothetical protein
VTNKDEHKRTRKPNIKNYAFVFLILDRLLGSERRKRREKGSGRDVNTAGQLDVTGRRLTAQSPKKLTRTGRRRRRKENKKPLPQRTVDVMKPTPLCNTGITSDSILEQHTHTGECNHSKIYPRNARRPVLRSHTN